jgi:hypothetical protein
MFAAMGLATALALTPAGVAAQDTVDGIRQQDASTGDLVAGTRDVGTAQAIVPGATNSDAAEHPEPASTGSRSLARLSLVMMANWNCGTWAEMSNDTQAQADHWQRGYEAGRGFVDGAKAGRISREDVNAIVPMNVLLTLQGPSTEFVLGRLHHMIASDAHDEVSARDENGNRLPTGASPLVPEFWDMKAARLYRQGNCEALLAERPASRP